MTDAPSLLAYTLAAGLLALTPGLDTAMVLRTAAVGGARPAALAALGIALGCLAWGALVSVGLGALIAASEVGFTLLKWMGAAYLLWVGLGLIVSPRGRFEATGPDPARDGRDALRRGFLTNLLNPKVGVFYVTFLPQFVPAGASVAAWSFLLAAVHVLLSLLVFAVLIGATVPVGRLLARPAVLSTLDRLTGAVFVGFGVKLALARAG
ncbi:LysE family translocator [Prosthecomicrobium sp. N25]|uniref:LysE family translocator n=1 Tax=Prosthecomicrobium sp. N25 TaxID=3129254 RepID=UPI003077D40D